MREKFLEAMNFRHACKLFDTTKSVREDDLRYILEVGRLSPSSIGLEHWKFLVVKNPDTKMKLQHGCYNQPQVGTASVIVVILAKKAALEPNCSYVERVLRRATKTQEQYAQFRGFYERYYSTINPAEWSVSQCHIAAANMMTAAAFIGIDSCPIAGFDAHSVMASLGVDEKEYELALVLPFGYRAHEAQPKQRLDFDELVEFLD